MQKHKKSKTIILVLYFISLVVLLRCERNFNPFHTKLTSSTNDFCNPTPPSSIPGKIGEWELAGLASDTINPIRVIAIHPKKPYILFVGTGYNFSDGTDAQLFRSADYGTTWGTLGNSFGNGAQFNDIVFDPFSPNIIYVANGRVLFKSSDCGETWENITGDIYVDWETYICDITIDPENTSILYAGTAGFGGGHLYKSIDAGNHWRRIESNIISSVSNITINAQYPQVVYLSTSDVGSILKSTDAGETWEKTGLSDTGLRISDILIDNENSNVIYAAVDHWIDSQFEVDLGIMRSTDGGVTWERFNEGLPIEAVFIPHKIIKNIYTNDLYLTLTLGDGGNTYLYKKGFGATTWEKIREWSRSDPIEGCLSLSPAGDMLYFGNKGFFRLRLN